MLTIPGKRLFLLLAVAICVTAQAQELQQKLDSFSNRFMAAILSQQKPKAYLFTDKSIYKAGESIWFRAFLINAVTQRVYTKSKYLFVDLVNANDSVVSVVLLDAGNQQLDGRVQLPNYLTSGNYWLRAYTRQMTVQDTAACAVESLYIVNKNSSPSPARMAPKAAVASAQSPTLQFYPEGGALMTGINNIIAFLIQDASGRPVVARGPVKDNHGTIVARFFSNAMGLGKFELSPSRYKTYTACLNWNGKEICYPLPAYNFRAAQLAVTKQDGTAISLRVLLEDSLFKEGMVTYVLGVSKDSLCFAGIGRGLYALDVPAQKFPEGAATFYLFDSSFRYLSERGVYVKNNNLQVRATLDKDTYGKRDNVVLAVAVTDASNKAIPALFTVAVVDSAFATEGSGCATSGLNNSSLAHLQCLTNEERDLVLLMQHSLYLNTTQSKSNTTSVYDDSLLYIKGTAFDEKGNPAAFKMLTLLSSQGSAFFSTDTTDAKGRFLFPVPPYFDSTQFVIEAKELSGKSTRISIVRDAVSFPHFTTPVSLKQPLPDPVIAGYYRRMNMDTVVTGAGKSLPNVTVTGVKEASYFDIKRVSTSSVIITPDMLDERRNLGDIILNIGGLHMLQGYLVIGGLTAMKAPDASSEPLILINGVQVAAGGTLDQSPAISTLNSINPKDVAFVEILKGPEGANYGVRGGNGVILVNMVSSRREIANVQSNLQQFYAKGISRAPLFPVVHYENATNKSAEVFDNQSTLFWDGAVLSGSNDPVQLHFFTSDVPSTYKVIINGITARGDIIYKTLTFYTK